MRKLAGTKTRYRRADATPLAGLISGRAKHIHRGFHRDIESGSCESALKIHKLVSQSRRGYRILGQRACVEQSGCGPKKRAQVSLEPAQHQFRRMWRMDYISLCSGPKGHSFCSNHEKAVEEKRDPQLWRHSKKNSRPRLCSLPRTTGRSRLRNTTLQRIVDPVLSVGCRASDCTQQEASMIELLRGVIPEIPCDRRPICSRFFVLSLHSSDALPSHRRHLRSSKPNHRITGARKSVSESLPK